MFGACVRQKNSILSTHYLYFMFCIHTTYTYTYMPFKIVPLGISAVYEVAIIIYSTLHSGKQVSVHPMYINIVVGVPA